MEDREELGLPLLELRLQHLAEEGVLAIPLTVVVEGNEERVAALERLQASARVLSLEQMVAERRADPLEDRRPTQEGNLGGLEPGQVLGSQVVGDEAIVTAERRSGIARFRLEHDELREVEPSGPPFRAPVHRGGLRGGELRSESGEQLPGLVFCERDLSRAVLDQSAPCSDLRQRETRVGAAGERELRSRRRVLLEHLERVQAL